MPVPSPAITLAEREKREPTYWPRKPCDVASTSPPSPALAPLPPELVTPGNGERRLLRGQRVLSQPVGGHHGRIEQVEVADRLRQQRRHRPGPERDLRARPCAIATARSASACGSEAAVADTLATRLPTKTRSETSSPSDASVALDLAEPHRDAGRAAAHGDRVGGIRAGLLRRLDERGDAVDKLGGIDAGFHDMFLTDGIAAFAFAKPHSRTIYCSGHACAMGAARPLPGSRPAVGRSQDGEDGMAVAASTLYSEILLLLGGAVVAAPLFKRIGLGTILGYLAAGIAIGPAARLITDGEEILHVAELGIVFLLFIIGLEIKPSRLWSLKREIFGLGLAQVMVTGVRACRAGAICWSALAGRPRRSSASAWRCRRPLSPCRSSSRKARPTPNSAQTAFSILLFQDIAIVPLLALIPLLAPGRPKRRRPASSSSLIAVAAIAALLIAGRYLLNPLFGSSPIPAPRRR